MLAKRQSTARHIKRHNQTLSNHFTFQTSMDTSCSLLHLKMCKTRKYGFIYFTFTHMKKKTYFSVMRVLANQQ